MGDLFGELLLSFNPVMNSWNLDIFTGGSSKDWPWVPIFLGYPATKRTPGTISHNTRYIKFFWLLAFS
jgi:hypothetical protein